MLLGGLFPGWGLVLYMAWRVPPVDLRMANVYAEASFNDRLRRNQS